MRVGHVRSVLPACGLQVGLGDSDVRHQADEDGQRDHADLTVTQVQAALVGLLEPWATMPPAGEACGLTETRSWARRCSNHNAVMIETIDAEDA